MAIDILSPLSKSKEALPPLPPHAIERKKIAAWLEILIGSSFRLLVAPQGYGKTTILLQEAYRNTTESILYVCCSPQVSFLQSLAEASKEDLDEENILRILTKYDLILLDNLENIDEQGKRFLARIIDNSSLKNIIAASSRKDIVELERIASGVVSLCSVRMLQFDIEEILAIAQQMKLPLSSGDALALRDLCGGWPLAISAALRYAKMFETGTSAALQTWRIDQHSTIVGLIEKDLKKLSPKLQDAWKDLTKGLSVSESSLRKLEAAGMHVFYFEQSGYTLLPIIKSFYQPAVPQPLAPPRLDVKMFGVFSCVIEGQQVQWLRKMDKRIFRYLLLTKTGSESRTDIIERFWPNTPRSAALTSLRTSCSNIKKALSNLVGNEYVEKYFTVNENLSVNLDNINIDVRRFISHMRTANAALATDSTEQALYHYQQAEHLYTAPLGWGDEDEEWISQLVDECKRMRMLALQNTVKILKDLGREHEASQYEVLINERKNRHTPASSSPQ
jgi:Bacterial transcriptional activator domain